MKVIVSENVDGSVGITTMAPNAPVSISEHANELKARGVNVVAEIDDATLPDNAGAAMEHVLDESTMEVNAAPYTDQRRCFRNQWVWNGTSVVENPTAVQAEKVARAKAVRNRMLALTDSEEFRLTGPALAAIRAWRQSLRDLGADIDADPDNIVWPSRP